MPILSACPSCGRRFQVPDSLFGKTISCPKCQARVTVTKPPNSQVSGHSSPPAALVPTVRTLDQNDEAQLFDFAEQIENVRPSRPSIKNRRRVSTGFAVVVIGLLVSLLAWGTLAWLGRHPVATRGPHLDASMKHPAVERRPAARPRPAADPAIQDAIERFDREMAVVMNEFDKEVNKGPFWWDCDFLAILVLMIAVSFLFYLALALWVAKDCRLRGIDNAGLWALIVFFLGFLGLLFYLVMRSQLSRFRPGGPFLLRAHDRTRAGGGS